MREVGWNSGDSRDGLQAGGFTILEESVSLGIYSFAMRALGLTLTAQNEVCSLACGLIP